MKLWLDAAFALARTITTAAPSTVTTKRRKLERTLDYMLAATATCDLARDIQNRMRRARNQLLSFAYFPGRVKAHISQAAHPVDSYRRASTPRPDPSSAAITPR